MARRPLSLRRRRGESGIRSKSHGECDTKADTQRYTQWYGYRHEFRTLDGTELQQPSLKSFLSASGLASAAEAKAWSLPIVKLCIRGLLLLRTVANCCVRTPADKAKVFSMSRHYSLIFLLSLAIAGCGEKKITQAPPAVKNVLVTSVRVMDVPVQLHEFGRLSSPESVNVQPQVSGENYGSPLRGWPGGQEG